MTPCTFKVKVGRRVYAVSGMLPSDTPTPAERTAAGEVARAALFASQGAECSYSDLAPDWATAVGVVQSVEWVRSAAV